MVLSSWGSIPVVTESLPEFVLKCLSLSPHTVAMVDGESGREVTFKELISTIRRLASGLKRHGLGKGDIVGILAPNCFEYVQFLIAVMMTGAVPATVNPLYTAYELINAVSLTKATWWMTTSSLKDKLTKAVKESKSFVKVIILLDSIEKNENRSDVMSFLTLLETDDGDDPRIAPCSDVNPRKDPALIMFSSGTTGLPKAVMLSHFGVISILTIFRTLYGINDFDHEPGQQPVSLIILPIFHVFGMIGVMMQSLAACHKLVILPRFAPETTFKCIEMYKVTILALVPSLMLYMVQHPEIKKAYKLDSIKRVMCGASPLSEQAQETFQTLYNTGQLSQGYGMTETSLSVLMNMPGRPLKKNSVGQVLPNNEVMIRCLESKKDLGPNQKGEICVRSPQVMLGYMDNPQSTKEIIDENGWLHTGDIGYYDNEGYFYVTGRIKELIKYKGFQIAPAEIEALLVTHPAVLDAAVIGVPDELSGEVPKAFVVKKQSVRVTDGDIKKLVAETLSSYKSLRGGVEFVDSIPRNHAGKILRYQLRDKYGNGFVKPKSKL